MAALDHRIFPLPEQVADWLGGEVQIHILPIGRDCIDRMLGAFWAHPEWVLDEQTRNATSGFARQPVEVVNRVVAAVGADLTSGQWDERYGHLRELEELDVGLRLIVARP